MPSVFLLLYRLLVYKAIMRFSLYLWKVNIPIKIEDNKVNRTVNDYPK